VWGKGRMLLKKVDLHECNQRSKLTILQKISIGPRARFIERKSHSFAGFSSQAC